MKKTLALLLILCLMLTGCSLPDFARSIPDFFKSVPGYARSLTDSVKSLLGIGEPRPTEIPVLPAYQVYAEYKADPVAADAKYKGQMVAISGTVFDVNVTIPSSPYILLESAPVDAPDKPPVICAVCLFNKNTASGLLGLKKGDAVVVLGKGYNFNEYVYLRDCIVAK